MNLMSYLIAVDWRVLLSAIVSNCAVGVIFIWMAYKSGYHNGFDAGHRKGIRFSQRKCDERV
jgi:hypothetical protein